MNDGNGQFFAGPPFTFCCLGGNIASHVAIGDLNGDSLPDLVLDSIPSAVFLLFNNGALDFTIGAATLAVGPGVAAFSTLGDADGDGDLDLCIARVSGTGPIALQPMLWTNNGSGTFSNQSGTALPLIASFVDRAAFRDFDLDGDLDLLLWQSATNVATPSPQLLLVNGGSGVFNAVIPVPGPGSGARLAIGDFNGDLLPDVAYSSPPFSSPAVEGITMNTGLLTFAAFVPAPVPVPSNLLAADLNGDGVDEIARLSIGLQTLTIHPVLPGGIIGAATQTLPDWGYNAFSGDLDGDGDLDWVSSALVPQMNDGSGFLVQVSGDVVLPGLGIPVLGDVDGDGDVDAVSCGPYAGAVGPFVVNKNDGFGNFAPDPAFCAAGSCPVCAVAESLFGIALDGDGDLDLFAGYPVNTIWRNVGASFVPAAVVAQPGVTTSLAQGDVNGDGLADLVLGSMSPPGPLTPFPALVVLDLGPAGFSAPIPLPVSHVTRDLALFDADLDGDLDVVEANFGGLFEASVIFLNDGAGNFSPAPPAALPAGQRRSVVAGDIDGDGDVDLVMDDVLFWNDGSGTFTPGPALPNAFFARDAFDADMDGDLDLLATGNTGAGILYLNAGGGTFPSTEPVFGVGAFRPPRADVDFDVDPDLVASGRLLSNTTRQISRGALTRIGRPASIQMHGPPGMPFVLYVSAGSTHLPVPPYGTVLIDPFTALFVTSGFFSAAGTASFGGLAPNSPALIGFTVYWQAGLPVQQRLTNLEIMTVLGI